MPWEDWNAVDDYLGETLLGADPVLPRVLEANARGGLPAIDVSPCHGRMLELLVRLSGARRVLEVGTLGGYSTICLARGLPAGGRVVTVEVNPDFAAVAAANLREAGVADRVQQRIGAGVDVLADLAAEDGDPFGLVFIDADKVTTPQYFARSLDLARPGSLIIVDNVIRDGAVTDADSDDPGVVGMRRFLADAGAEDRVLATAIQTVGVKGWDGFALALVR